MQKHSLNRREILTGATAAGIIAAAGVSPAASKEHTTMRVPGIQLYTVRDAMATDVAATLQAVAGIGYREVEFAGYFDHSPGDIRRLLEQFDLASPSTHAGTGALRDDAQSFADTAATIGHEYVTLAWLAPEERETIDDYKRWAEVLNRAGEVCRSQGLRVAYHNHDFEFVPLAGRVPFDVLLEETDADLVDFELDFFWVRKAGQDILEVIGRAAQRFVMSHIKDMDVAGEMADVGKGTIDFAAILADPRANAIRHCFVEHDAPADPFQSVAFSHYSLKAILD